MAYAGRLLAPSPINALAGESCWAWAWELSGKLA